MIYTILILGLIFRLASINQSFWLDEAIGALVVKEQGLVSIASQFPRGDNHPPLYYLMLEIWSNLFGFSEIALRSLSVIFGVMTIFLVFQIAKKIVKNNKFYSLFSALLLASSPLHIYYSQEARMYVVAAFFAAASFYFFLQTFEKKRKKYLAWIFFSLSILGLVFTDYLPVFLLPAFWLIAFLRKEKKAWWKSFIVSHLPLVAAGIIWLPLFIIQVQGGAWLLQKLPAWRELAGGATLKQAALVWAKFVLGRISFRDKALYYTLVVLSSIPFIYLLFSAWRKKNKIKVFWLWLAVPLAAAFVVSFIFPAFIYFRLIFVLPAFYLVLAWGVEQIKDVKLRVLVGFLILLVHAIGWLIYTNEPYQQRERWREAVSFLEKEAGQETVVLFENPEPFAPFRWYSKGKLEAYGATNSISADEAPTKEKTAKLISEKEGLYYFEYLKDLHDPNGYVLEAIREAGFKEKEVFDFIGVGQVRYWSRD